jgi:hypothetical protein
VEQETVGMVLINRKLKKEKHRNRIVGMMNNFLIPTNEGEIVEEKVVGIKR